MRFELEGNFEKEYALYYRETNKLLEFFEENKGYKIFAYGNSLLYERVKREFEIEGGGFNDVLITKNGNVCSSINEQRYINNVKNVIVVCSSYYFEIVPLLLKIGVQEKQIRIAFSSRSTDSAKEEVFLEMQSKHEKLLENIKGKKKIKVVFLAIHKSVWKVDPVFQKMLADPFFEPIILVCPYTVFGDERMWQDMKECYEYFEQKGYPLLSSYNKEEQRWISLEEIQPDIVFFTNPHSLTFKEYYEDAYLNYLSCYVGYGYFVVNFGSYNPQYNQTFHNALWINFAINNYNYQMLVEYSKAKGVNAILTGFPAIEDLFEVKEESAWKNNDSRKRIIFAPHHTIEKGFRFELSNFLEYADYMIEISKKYKDKIVWSFKPHPLLKSKLYRNVNWGKKKTDEYYNYWLTMENTQLDEGEYVALFQQSDAMIHDSASFLVEYLTQKKPALYLCTEKTQEYLDVNGLRALKSHSQAFVAEDIETFIDKLINNDESININSSFYENEFESLYGYKLPSEKIVEILKKRVSS